MNGIYTVTCTPCGLLVKFGSERQQREFATAHVLENFHSVTETHSWWDGERVLVRSRLVGSTTVTEYQEHVRG